MNQLHPNDKQNRTKHRKMLRRIAERKPNAMNHPRLGKSDNPEIFKSNGSSKGNQVRNTDWVSS